MMAGKKVETKGRRGEEAARLAHGKEKSSDDAHSVREQVLERADKLALQAEEIICELLSSQGVEVDIRELEEIKQYENTITSQRRQLEALLAWLAAHAPNDSWKDVVNDDYRNAADTISRLQKQVAELDAKLNDTAAAHAADHNNAARLQTELDAVRGKLAAATKNAADTQKQLNEEREKAAADTQRLQDELQQTKRDLQRSNDLRKKEKADFEAWRQELEDMNVSKDVRHKAAVDTINKEKEELEKRLSQENTTLRKTARVLEEKVRSLEAEVAEEQRKREEAAAVGSAASAQLRQEVADAVARAADAEQRLQETQQALEETRAALAAAEEEQAAAAAAAAAAARVETVDAECQAVAGHHAAGVQCGPGHEALVEEEARMQRELQEARAQAEQLHKECDALHARVKEQAAQLAQKKKSASSSASSSSAPSRTPRRRLSSQFVRASGDAVHKRVSSVLQEHGLTDNDVTFVGKGKYKFRYGQEHKMVNILQRGDTFVVRVGGGWVSLDEFIREYVEKHRHHYRDVANVEDTPAVRFSRQHHDRVRQAKGQESITTPSQKHGARDIDGPAHSSDASFLGEVASLTLPQAHASFSSSSPQLPPPSSHGHANVDQDNHTDGTGCPLPGPADASDALHTKHHTHQRATRRAGAHSSHGSVSGSDRSSDAGESNSASNAAHVDVKDEDADAANSLFSAES